MTILSGWHRVLRRQSQTSSRTILLDEGPVCLLARLHSFDFDPARNRTSRTWWNNIYKQWAETIDVIIWLDTPVPVLLSRIRNRAMQYEVGTMSDEEALRHLSRIRLSQEHALHALSATTPCSTVIRFSTTDMPPQHICDEILTRLGLG